MYRIPVRDSVGYRAAEWKDVLWTGQLVILAQGRQCMIRLLDCDSKKTLFAKCPVNEKITDAVERAVDSSRYFALRLDDGAGRCAVVGLGFNDRNDAFDFIYCLNDFFSRQRKQDIPPLPVVSKDYGLKEGECLELSSKAFPPRIRRENASGTDFKATENDQASGITLPPPPAIGKKRKPVKGKTKVADA